MNLGKLIEQAEKRHCGSLTPDQHRDIRGRLVFADIDPENIKKGEVSLVVDTILSVAANGVIPTMERTAALAQTCPRCGAKVAAVKLADGVNAAYCQSCRIALAET